MGGSQNNDGHGGRVGAPPFSFGPRARFVLSGDERIPDERIPLGVFVVARLYHRLDRRNNGCSSSNSRRR